ncbi:MAG: ankyrin repeat domain-containing protein [Treponema sp.]|nr:ankyrin repeat domain-containing protein [Treponema sp.]MCL2250902.1 ankyrin repeat domain-containing protein [Treponema sp.]
MKKSSFFPALLSTLSIIIFYTSVFCVIGCKSTPAAQERTIWELLLSRDQNAKGYFLSEVEVNATDDNGRTPLHYAVELQDVQLVDFFLKLGAKPDVHDLDFQTPLGMSVEKNNAAIAKLIAEAGADIHLVFKNEISPAALALRMDPNLFRSLLTPSNIEAVDRNNYNRTVLHMAAIAGNIPGVYSILALVPSSSNLVNKTDNLNKNALDYSLDLPNSRSHMEIAEQLILKNAFSNNVIYSFLGPAIRSGNYNIRRNEGLAAIHFAVMNSYSGLISYLLGKDIDINIKSTSGATALHEAVRIGNIPVINMLLNANADVNAKDANNNTPLHMGIPAEVHKEIITLLLNRNADINLRDNHGATPLHITIILNRPLDVIQTLLNANSNVHIRNIEGKTPLYIAVQENRSSLIPALLAKGSEIFAADNSGKTPFDLAIANDTIFNMLISSETVNQRDSEGNTMLHAAVRNRANPAQISRILDNKALVDAINREGDTALHIAVRMNQKESGEFLISRGANIFLVNSSDQSPLSVALSSTPLREWIINPTTMIAKDGSGNNMLHLAAGWKLDNVIPIMIKSGLSIEEPNATGETPVFMAVKYNSPSTINVLVENNANLNARDALGYSVLHTAVRWNAKETVELLISLKMDIDAHSHNGNTPLHDSVILRMNDIESILIRNGADLEAKNIDGNTPFMEAVRADNLASVERLFQRADTSTRNIRGDTPLHIAVSGNRREMAARLLRIGNVSIHARNTTNRTPYQIALNTSSEMVSTLLTADRINISDDMGNSVLHIAVLEKAPNEMINLIITKGARVNSVDSNGKTPLRLAVDLNSWESAKAIADAGADPFIPAVDNRTAAEIAFTKGDDCIKAIFSGRAINSKDSAGNTVLHTAARYGTPANIAILVELGANKTIRNFASESPYDIAVRWNRSNNAEVLR